MVIVIKMLDDTKQLSVFFYLIEANDIHATYLLIYQEPTVLRELLWRQRLQVKINNLDLQHQFVVEERGDILKFLHRSAFYSQVVSS